PRYRQSRVNVEFAAEVGASGAGFNALARVEYRPRPRLPNGQGLHSASHVPSGRYSTHGNSDLVAASMAFASFSNAWKAPVSDVNTNCNHGLPPLADAASARLTMRASAMTRLLCCVRATSFSLPRAPGV